MRHLTRIWTILVAALLLSLAACGSGKEGALPAGSKVLALGDSITAGYGIAQDEAWPARLALRSGWTIVNAGVSGDTSDGALSRLPQLLEAHSPQLVIVEIGGNDMLRQIEMSRIESNLRSIVELAQQRGARTVLLGVPRPSLLGAATGRLSPADIYASVAKSGRSLLVEDALGDVLSEPALRLDPLHPNAAGHRRLGEQIERALREAGMLR